MAIVIPRPSIHSFQMSTLASVLFRVGHLPHKFTIRLLHALTALIIDAILRDRIKCIRAMQLPSLIPTADFEGCFDVEGWGVAVVQSALYRGTSLIRNSASLGPYRRTMPGALCFFLSCFFPYARGTPLPQTSRLAFIWEMVSGVVAECM